MLFFQDPPRLANAYVADPLLREYLSLELGADLSAIEPELEPPRGAVGGRPPRAAGRGASLEPRHVALGCMGPAGGPDRGHAALEGSRHGSPPSTASSRRPTSAATARARACTSSRSLHVLEPSLDVYSCPLAMTDGAARTLLDAGNAALVARALPRLTSRDPGDGRGRAASG